MQEQPAASTPGPAAAGGGPAGGGAAAAVAEAVTPAAANTASTGNATACGFPAEAPHYDAPGRPEVSAEEVVGTRSGDVLLRHTILKSDHFPGGTIL